MRMPYQHAVAARDADQAEREMISTRSIGNFCSTPKYTTMIAADEDLQDQNELALG